MSDVNAELDQVDAHVKRLEDVIHEGGSGAQDPRRLTAVTAEIRNSVDRVRAILRQAGAAPERSETLDVQPDQAIDQA